MLIRCDNTAVVSSINSRYCKDPLLMQLLRCLFFLEAQYQFKLKAEHIPGVHNVLAYNLSRDNLVSFRQINSDANATPSDIPYSVSVATPPQPQLDLTSLDGTVQFFRQHGIANSTQKTYKSALRRFVNFCEIFNVLSSLKLFCVTLCHFLPIRNYHLRP